ncbi:unnamed protein product, partial [Onchocerca flexuosa]
MYFQHISPVIVRAQSARPTASRNKRITKDSAFESGESTHPYHRRPSLDYYRNEPDGITNCRHDTYFENQCIHCAQRQSSKRRYESDMRRTERRTMSVEPVGTNLKQIKRSFGDSSKTIAALIWPIDVLRLAPSETIGKAGRFSFQKNGTIVYKANIRNRSQSINRNGVINDEVMIKWVATVKRTTNGAQEFSVFRQPD